MGRVKPRAGEISQAEREDRIHKALVQRAESNTPWAVLALEFGIPASTLNDRYKGWKNRHEAHHNQQKLPPTVEKALKKWCEDRGDAGFPPRVDLLRGMATALAQNFAEEENLGSEAAYIGKNWISRFLNRNPDLAAKYSTQIDRQRQNANNPVTLRDYFNKLSCLVRKLVYKGLRPSDDIYNFDKKGFILGYSSKAKVICRKGRRNPHVTQDGSRELITVIEAASSAGLVIPSWIIYKGKGHYVGWHTDTNDPEAVFAYSEKGWTDDKMGCKWLKEHFDVYSARISGNRPRLLIMDGQSSHLTYEFCSYAQSRHIYLICLPAHSTHLLQPLDVGLFGPLQHYYGKAADNYLRETRTGISKRTFWSLFSEARKKSYTKQNIQSSFRATGIFPFNPDKVLNKLKPIKTTHCVTPNRLKTLFNQHFQTPRNRRDLRQQTQYAFGVQNPADYHAVIKRLAHLAEESLSSADIARVQLRELRLKYEGKRIVRAGRRVISKAQIITGAEIMRLKLELEKKTTRIAVKKEKLAKKSLKRTGQKGKNSINDSSDCEWDE